jgi:hypothetical protein
VDVEGDMLDYRKEGRKRMKIPVELERPPSNTQSPSRTKKKKGKKSLNLTHLLTLPIPPIPITHGLRPRVPTTTESGR